MKKLFSALLLATVLCACILLQPTETQAVKNGHYSYTLSSDGTAIILDCDSSLSGDITIPSTLGGCPVTQIGAYAFSNCTGLTSVVIPDGITSINNSAFSDCTRMTSIVIPSSVNYIGERAFEYCASLTNITLPNSINYINDNVFANCTSLTDITIPDGVGYIDYSAFYGCSSLTSVTIPDTVTEIRDYAFENCSALTSVLLPDGITRIGLSMFRGCSSLTSIAIPNGVGSIDNSAFQGCSSLTSISIPGSVAYIGFDAFEGCTNLTGVYITDLPAWCKIDHEEPDSNPLYYAGNLYLNGELVTDLVIPDSVQYIVPCAFYYCTSLENVTLADGTRYVEGRIFEGCVNMKSIIIPESVTDDIWIYAMPECKHILYKGTEDQWNDIDKESSAFHADALVTYNYTKGMEYHVYDGDSDKDCNVCGETRSAIHTHTWNSGVVTKEPTETATGIKTYTCTTCGATKTETLATLPPSSTNPAPTEPPATDSVITEPEETTADDSNPTEPPATEPDPTESEGATSGSIETSAPTEPSTASPTDSTEPQKSEPTAVEKSDIPTVWVVVLSFVGSLAVIGGIGFFLWRKGILSIKR